MWKIEELDMFRFLSHAHRVLLLFETIDDPTFRTRILNKKYIYQKLSKRGFNNHVS